MAFDWIPRLFQSEQTRGLSGDSASAVALDESNPYYNYRLRRHSAEGDIVANPALLWQTEDGGSGLLTHVASEKGDGVANYTDILLILSAEDHDRAPSGYATQIAATLSQAFEAFCSQEQFSRVYSHRKLGFKVIVDGSPEMGGQVLGLGPGQFITGLLPNLYTGPVQGSYPVIGVHVNLPGVFEGYQEIGRLHNDQILFTIGNHWLDNYAHPSLREAALYRLQQYPDGSFVHIVNPDLQDRYQVTSRDQGGTNVLTLATRDGTPLAYMVLAVMEPPEDLDDAPEEARTARSLLAKPVAPEPSQPSMSPPMLLDEEVENLSAKPRPAPRKGSKTIIPDAPEERIFTLQERGALLQKVHFSAFMEGYDIYLGERGDLGTVVDNPAATFQVRRRSVSLKAHIELKVGGRTLPAGAEFTIEGDTTIEVGNEKLQYRDLRGLDVDGWPYVGEIRRPASSTYMIWGEQYRIGRSRECRVVLPDEPRNDNIAWKASVGDSATIRARRGEIPKSRFYTDSIMVASEHAMLDTKGDQPTLSCTAAHCYAYIRRNGQVMPLYPTTSGSSPQTLPLESGDEILIGNCLFQAGFSDDSDAIEPAPPPPSKPTPAPEPPSLNADDLVDAVDEPDFAEFDDGTGRFSVPPAPERAEPPPAPATPPPPPEPVASAPPASEPLQAAGMESVMGSAPSAMRTADLKDVQIPDLEDLEEATVPGMSIPRNLLAPEDTPEPLVDPQQDVVKGWDDDDWPDDDDVPTQGMKRVDIDALQADEPSESEAPADEPSESEAPADEPSEVEAAAEESSREEVSTDIHELSDDDDEAAPEQDIDEAPEPSEPPVVPSDPGVAFEDDEDGDATVMYATNDVEKLTDLTNTSEPQVLTPPSTDQVGTTGSSGAYDLRQPPQTAPADAEPQTATSEDFGEDDATVMAAPYDLRQPPTAPPPVPEASQPPPLEDDEPTAPPAAPVAPPAPPEAVDETPEPHDEVDEDDLPTREATAHDVAAPSTPAMPPPDAPTASGEETLDDARVPGKVVATDDSEAQFELGRPLHIVQSGWMAKGELVAGNHSNADLIIPENRIEASQRFEPCDYFRLKVRGRRGHLDVLAPSELLINEADPDAERYDDLDALTIDVIRRDDLGEEDFVVRVAVGMDRSLPDPRARFIALDYEDPLAAALVTRGLGLHQPRKLEFGAMSIDLEWTGSVVRFSNFLEGYQGGKGCSFFIQKDGQRFVTAPEDGSTFELAPGDRFVVDNTVYLVRGL